MLFHASICADDPRRVARVFAELWKGTATPFPPVTDGAWVAMAGDDRNTLIEVYPRGTELHEAEGDADAEGRDGNVNRHGPTHLAVATVLDAAAVFAIAEREGWPAKYRKRGDAFGVIELWVEGCQLIELLTTEMQSEYLHTMTVSGWNQFLRSAGVAA